MFLMLKKDWPGNFRRSVKNKKGEVVSVLEWSPGDRMEVTDKAELEAIKTDVGNALLEVAPPVEKPDKKEASPDINNSAE